MSKNMSKDPKPNAGQKHQKPLSENLQSEKPKSERKHQNDPPIERCTCGVHTPEKKKLVSVVNKPFGITGPVAAALQAYPTLLMAIHRALKSKGGMFRVSWYEVPDPVNHPERDIQHHFENIGFAEKDVLPALQHQKMDYIKKHMPNIDVATVVCPNCKKTMPDQRGFI